MLSPDLLCLSNVELSAVTSNLLISFSQHGGTGLVMTGLQTSMKLSLSVSSLQEVPQHLFSGVPGMTLCIKDPECIREEWA